MWWIDLTEILSIYWGLYQDKKKRSVAQLIHSYRLVTSLKISKKILRNPVIIKQKRKKKTVHRSLITKDIAHYSLLSWFAILKSHESHRG